MKSTQPATIATLEGTIRAIEERSSAEVVVEVRAYSGSYAAVDQRLGMFSAFAALLFVLFAPLTFAPWLVPFFLALSYALGLLACRSSNWIRRHLTTRRERQSRTRIVAATTFVERGIVSTRQRSGVLVLLSRLERRMEIIADRGVLDAVPGLEWNQLMAAAGHDSGLEELSILLGDLGSLLSRYLPRTADDVNELPDNVRMFTE